MGDIVWLIGIWLLLILILAAYMSWFGVVIAVILFPIIVLGVMFT